LKGKGARDGLFNDARSRKGELGPTLQGVSIFCEAPNPKPAVSPWRNQRWVTLYKVAMVETERARLKDRIDVAKSAMTDRARELAVATDAQSELDALADALRGLRVLGRETNP
jgi:hypothetical protein